MAIGLLGAAAALAGAALVTDPIAAGALLTLPGASRGERQRRQRAGRADLVPEHRPRPGHGRAADVGARSAPRWPRRPAADRRAPAAFRPCSSRCRRLPRPRLCRGPLGARATRHPRPAAPPRPAAGVRTVLGRPPTAAAEPGRPAARRAPVPRLGVPGRGAALRRRAVAGRRRRAARADPAARGARPARQRRVVGPGAAAGSARCASWPRPSASGSRWPRSASSGPAGLVAAVLVPAAALAISWNGLVFTAAGEFAPPGRAATAMAVSNTANYRRPRRPPRSSAGWSPSWPAGRPCSRWARSPRPAPCWLYAGCPNRAVRPVR